MLSSFLAGVIVGAILAGAACSLLIATERTRLPRQTDVWANYQGELIRRRAARESGRRILGQVLAGKRGGR
jgi:gas vesicle protein